MQKNIQYYCVGFTWKGSDPDNQLPRFFEKGIWEISECIQLFSSGMLMKQ
jgi:hypothetical protein